MSDADRLRWQRRYGERPFEPRPAESWLIDRALPVAGPVADRTVLDVAAGEGANALELAARGGRVTALDIAPRALDRLQAEARRRGLDLHTVVRDLDAPDALDGLGSFALVVIVKYKPSGAQWRAVVDRLEPGGHLCLCSFALTEPQGDAPKPEEGAFDRRGRRSAYLLDRAELQPQLERLGCALLLHEAFERRGDRLEGFVWRKRDV
ncbi:MAG: class I SAM-dependent methyltransferase [Geminicoccaceae bacterium]|nr:class I SAM-dependent methyltransferase [Geminicoccaceae bacterium]